MITGAISSAGAIATILTSRPHHPTLLALVDAGAERGMTFRCGPCIAPNSALVFRWGFQHRVALGAVRTFCTHHRIPLVNGSLVGKWEQLVRLSDADLPIPGSRRVTSLAEARHAARLLRYPVVIKPGWGKKSQGVELVEDEMALARLWTPTHRVIQQYLPEGRKCSRILVVGDRIVHAVTRVALDGFHATFNHGLSGTLEPYAPTAECAEIARAACRAIGVDVGGVDVVETANGPLILEVNHNTVELTDHMLHGPDAVLEVAEWLIERARGRRSSGPARAPRLRIVTGLVRHRALEPLQAACAQAGFAVEVSRASDPTVDATWFWGLTPGHHRRAATGARAVSMPAVNAQPLSLWAQRARLFRAGLPVPRSRFADGIEAALRAADELGFPLTVSRDRDGNETTVVRDATELTAAWPTRRARIVLELGRYAFVPHTRVWVAGDRAFLASRRARARWRRVALREAPCELAITACRALDVELGVVELALCDSGPVVLSVLPRGAWIARLGDAGVRAALQPIAAELRARIDTGDEPRPTHRPRLDVVIARGYESPGTGLRTANIQALYHELLRRGHAIRYLDGRQDRAVIAGADLILQDPLYAFGYAARGDELDQLLYEQAAERSHLLRRLRSGTTDKRAMHALAVELGIRSPATYSLDHVGASDLPLLVKPRQGSLGIGVRLIATPGELAALPRPSSLIAQQFIDSGTPYAISVRAVTVVDRVVAAALFYNADAICSNLARGGRAIALSGPGQRLELTRTEAALLERIGIDPRRREIPAEIADMAGRIGRHHARHGAQMIGQDFVVDASRRWHFLEVNMGFGTAVFNATDGEGFPSSGRGLAVAGRVLADAIERGFGRGTS